MPTAIVNDDDVENVRYRRFLSQAFDEPFDVRAVVARGDYDGDGFAWVLRTPEDGQTRQRAGSRPEFNPSNESCFGEMGTYRRFMRVRCLSWIRGLRAIAANKGTGNMANAAVARECQQQ